eukprot:TRINITY_DN7857_c0_g1_i2.p1 TRINITY_DN7857_c0_g1~~TRINITY_DN7857_c0_g1_i2.p1  ORF type:complete len:207 (+),score=27.86 TRINITY_DN7857_c0_g1_i2:123-743(+)
MSTEGKSKKIPGQFSCSLCNFSTKYKWNLGKHKLKHSGSKPFTCKHCNKSFTEKTYLVKHEKAHAGEKPYSCHICDNKSYADKSQLRRHYESVEHKQVDWMNKLLNSEMFNEKEITHLDTETVSDKSNQLLNAEKSTKEGRSHNKELSIKVEIEDENLDAHVNDMIIPSENTAKDPQMLENYDSLQFVNCGESIKQEIKEEIDVDF